MCVALFHVDALQADGLYWNDEGLKKLPRGDISIGGATGGFSDAYLTTMAQEGTWGDGVILSCASRLYKRAIHVVSPGKPAIIIEGCKTSLQPVITMGYISSTNGGTQDHYIPLSSRKVDCHLPAVPGDQFSHVATPDYTPQTSLSGSVQEQDLMTASTPLTTTQIQNQVSPASLSPLTCPQQWPHVWDEFQWRCFKEKYVWLYCRDGYLGKNKING